MRKLKNSIIAIGLLTMILSIACNRNRPRPAVAVLTQGLRENALVAGKTTALRLVPTNYSLSFVDGVQLTLTRPDGSIFTGNWSKSQFITLPAGVPGLGESIVLEIPGKELSDAGQYSFEASVVSGAGEIVQKYTNSFELARTKDLRFLVTYLFKRGTFEPNQDWDADIARSMQRLGAILPVRDGVQASLNGNTTSGIRYQIGEPCDGYVDGYYDCVYEQTRKIDASVGDHIDVTIEYRPGLYAPEWNPPGDNSPGGNSGPPPSPYADLRRSSCVAGLWRGIEMTAACIAQENGHNFGLEPPGSPHFQDLQDPRHSKDPLINDPDAYDSLLHRLYPLTLGDTMNNSGGGAFRGVDSISLNAYDWEFWRAALLVIPSTGPTNPHDSTNAAPAVAAVGDNLYLFAKTVDGRIVFNRAKLGEGGVGWKEVEGNRRTDAAPAAAAIGTHVFVAIKGLDGEVYVNQADLGQRFGEWFPAGFQTDVAPALAAVGNEVYFFAKHLDGRIFYNHAKLGEGGVGWKEVEGHGRTGDAPAAAAIGDHVFLAVKAMDRNIVVNQADLDQAFGEWFPTDFHTDVAPGVATVKDNVYFLAKRPDGRIFYNQAKLREGGAGWKEIEGDGLTDFGPSGASVGTQLFIAVKGLDGRVWVNQAEFPNHFGKWFPS
jgi:hypothetical protein